MIMRALLPLGLLAVGLTLLMTVPVWAHGGHPEVAGDQPALHVLWHAAPVVGVLLALGVAATAGSLFARRRKGPDPVHVDPTRRSHD